MGNYVIYMVLLAFLLFNLYVLYMSQRRKKVSAAELKRQEGELAKLAKKEEKKQGLNFSAHSTYMNDAGVAIMAAIDPKKRVLGIFMGEDVRLIPYDDIEKAEVVSQTDEKTVYSISVEIRCRSGLVLTYPFATIKRKKKGWITDFILKDSGSFADSVNSLRT
jgi:hypothetical protein